MKRIVTSEIFFFIIIILIFSCKKNTQNSGQSQNAISLHKAKTVKVKIIEYGSDLPIAGAKLTICTTAIRTQIGLECAGNYLSYITDANGECFFRTDSIYKLPGINAVLKDGYVELYEPENPCLFEYNTMHLPNGSNQADSFIIRKVPYRYVTVHIKNTNADLDTDLYLHFRAIYNSRFTNITCRSGFINPVKLRQWIDTTFQYLAFGNMDNEYIISKNVDYDGGITIIGKVFQKIEYIPKTGYVTVEILY